MSSLQRLLKLRKMSAGEIRVRIAGRLRERRERNLSRRVGRRIADGPSACSASTNLCASAAALVPGSRAEEFESLRNNFPELYTEFESRVLARAEAGLSGAKKLLGHAVDLRQDVDWHRDPRSEFRWPLIFYADVPLYELDSGVDVKYVWELGRQQYLADLSRGWLFSRRQQYAERSRDLMLDWIRRNPLYEGVHWTSALEVAMRSISWIWTIATLAEWDGWSPENMRKIAESLAEHATYLEHHFSYYSSPYNHLIGEATGLYFISSAIPESDRAHQWRRMAQRTLTQHGPRQFYDDGFCVEQATGYHFFTLGFLSLAIAAARNEKSPLTELERVVHRAYLAGAALRQPDGRWPAIGDVDSARSIPVLPDEFWDFRSMCSLGAVLFDEAKLKLPDTCPGEELYWLLGCGGVKAWYELRDEPFPKSTVLNESGYAVARSDAGDWLLFDAGPIANGLHADATPSTAHGHADALQVLYMHAGKQLLVDPGIPSYAGSRYWVDYFREATAHNTFEIEGVPLARTAGRLAWSHVAKRPQLDANLSEEAWLARGCVEWGLGVIVERYLLVLPGKGLFIADWIKTDQTCRVRWFWQLPAGTVQHLEKNDPHSCIVKGDGGTIATWADSVCLDCRLETADDHSPVAWQAPGYGEIQSGQRVYHEAEVTRNALVATYVGPAPVPFEVIVRGRGLACSDDVDWQRNESRNLRDSSGSAVAWRIQTDPEFCCVAGDSAGWDETDSLRGVGRWPAVAKHRSKSPAHSTELDIVS